MKQNNGEFTLKDLWDFMISKIWVIVIFAIVGGFSVYTYAKSHNSITYSVTTSLFVESLSETDGVKTSNVSVSKQRVPLYMEIIHSNRDFHLEILNCLDEEERQKYGFSISEDRLSASLSKMSSMIRTEQSGDLEMFYVHVTAPTEECALRISKIIRDLALEEDPKQNAVYKNIGAPSTISCVDSPRTNGASASQNPKVSLVVGALAGALLAIFALWLYSALDNRIHNQRDLELNFDIPVLGVIPKVSVDSISNAAYLENARRGDDE